MSSEEIKKLDDDDDDEQASVTFKDLVSANYVFWYLRCTKPLQ